MRTRVWTLALTSALLGGVACSDGHSVGLAITSRGGSTTTTQEGDSTLVVRGTDTLIIRSVELVLREIELERVEDLADCDSTINDDACEEFSIGLRLVHLPLGDEIDRIITADLAAGIYDEVEFEIHKPDEAGDAVFIAAHPDFEDVAIRVTGTLSRAGTRTDFTFTTDLNEEQEVELDPPLDVTTDGTVNLTIRLDIASWFLTAAGTGIVDPASANKGGANENLVRDNIKASIDAFHDDDGDGLDDDVEDNSGPGD